MMLTDKVFSDRLEAGRLLAAALMRLELSQPLILALPRGGVPVAAMVAKALQAPLELLIVRKIGAPGHAELAVGAVAEGDSATVIDPETAHLSGATAPYIEREARVQREELDRRRRLYRAGRPALSVAGRTVVVVDDGIATGTTMRAALQALRLLKPAKLVLAVPVAAAQSLAGLRPLVDTVVCLSEPSFFGSVGAHYEQFPQLSDEEVLAWLRSNREGRT
ncbi:phosphoribosyltransferase [Roseateles oligotrophus]|uniref:Phosphoribosyltransferase n=1 Tax=Roseateles oligotrophus TaxID=1769250 RepID=A0ABT2YML8_9BURK|nr:phosphoribosyltransferase family protein [Roseateles oligotrophus]MCV2371317.1 phosphoribosyltransferase [Roseateles oligotrophus]